MYSVTLVSTFILGGKVGGVPEKAKIRRLRPQMRQWPRPEAQSRAPRFTRQGTQPHEPRSDGGPTLAYGRARDNL